MRDSLGVTIQRQDPRPLYRQIARQVAEAIRNGRLSGDQPLPTIRALAQSLGVNRLTVSRAYSELSSEGLIVSRVGSGTRVAADAGIARAGPAGDPAARRISWGTLFSRSTEKAIGESLPLAPGRQGRPNGISFASLFPDPALFPVEELRAAMDDVLRRSGRSLLGYGPPAGYLPLRRMIAGELARRSVHTTAQEIVITSGSQQGIDLVARALLDPGDLVLVEDPTYTAAVQVFHSYGAELVGIPVDEDGLAVDVAEEVLSRRRPKLVYVMPNFQNPTSRTMSIRRRRALVDLARFHGLPILEDDFGGDLRYEGVSLPPLKSFGDGQNVIYLSTFAKKLLPGLRIGWLAAPAEMAQLLGGLKKIADYSTSLLLQAALHEFCSRGNMDDHLARILESYRARRDAMLDAMRGHFPASVSWTRPEGGLAVWVTFPEGVDAGEVAAAAEARSVLVGRGDLFFLESGDSRHMRLTFSQATPSEIREGIAILGGIIMNMIKAAKSDPRGGTAESLPLI